MIERDELAAWLRLVETPQVGRESARRLLAAFGSPQAAIDAPQAVRREVVGAKAAAALDQPDAEHATRLQATLEWLADDRAESHRLLTLGDPGYPSALLETADPPLMLYLRGRAELLGDASIAIVGSRHPTPQGLANAHAFARALGEAGWTVVSGLALGIDGAAHQGALETDARTVAVVGTGLDVTYPKRHEGLLGRIAAEGLLVSEFSLGTPPLAAHFPIRNRVIAGLTRGTLVVEATLQSGSLITARLAAEAGREVFAIPGSIHAPQSRGCHALLKQGAKLAETAQDVLEELQGARTVAPRAPASLATPQADPLLDALGFDPVTVDALIARTGMSASLLNVRLLELELAGQVARLPGQLFQRVGQG